jgi:probable F420-dependent oxidoreductase
MARAAEEVGFDSIRMGDHLLYRGGGDPERGPLEAWTLLGALAAATSRISLGPMVACTAFHPPGLVAKMAATIDEVSGGRLVLGTGAGWNESEFRAFGLPFDRRVARFEESFEILRRLLAGERVTLEGRFWSVDAAVLVPPPERSIPLLVGGTSERLLAIALPHVDWWNCWYDAYGNTLDGFASLQARVSEIAERGGRDPASIARSAGVLVEHDPATPTGGGPAPLTLDELPSHLHALAEAGADEAIVILRRADEESIRAVGTVLTALDREDG